MPKQIINGLKQWLRWYSNKIILISIFFFSGASLAFLIKRYQISIFLILVGIIFLLIALITKYWGEDYER